MATNQPSQLPLGSKLLTVRELASYLGVSEKTVRRLVASGRIPFARIGWGVRFDPGDVIRWISARKEG